LLLSTISLESVFEVVFWACHNSLKLVSVIAFEFSVNFSLFCEFSPYIGFRYTNNCKMSACFMSSSSNEIIILSISFKSLIHWYKMKFYYQLNFYWLTDIIWKIRFWKPFLFRFDEDNCLLLFGKSKYWLLILF
jgi:hypothetical protein